MHSISTRRSPLPLLLCIALLAGCGQDDRAPQVEVEDVPFERIALGRNARLADTTEIRISDAEVWAAHTDSLTALGPIEEVDFDEQDVVLIARRVTSGGYDLTVEQVRRIDDRLEVLYVIEEPGEDCLTAQVMLTPFVAIAVPSSEQAIDFRSRIERYSCGVRQR